MLGESAGRSRVEQASFAHRPAQDLLDGEAVDHGLHHAAAADDRPRVRAVAPRLVVGDAQFRRTLHRLDDVHGAAQDEAIVDADRLGLAALVASFV